MANVGKFIDRNPDLRAAGVCHGSLDGAGDALKVYSVEEAAEDLVKAKCQQKAKLIRSKPVPRYPIIPINSMTAVLSPELQKSRFVAFREKFSEDLYFKKPQLGKALELRSKPDHITNESTILGCATQRSESVYELMMPKKTAEEVRSEYVRWHDKYLISHNDFFPSERINRHYDPRYFNPNNTFGITTITDATGGNVHRCLVSCDRLVLIKKAQKEFLERNFGRPPFDKLNAANFTFGEKSSGDACDVQALLENIDPCVSKQRLIDALSHINKWRHILFKRADFHMHDLKVALERLDPARTGFLPVIDVYRTVRSLQIRIDEAKMRIILKHFNMIIDECLPTERIDYTQFWKLLIVQFPLPSVAHTAEIPNSVCQKETTYRQQCLDLEKPLVGADKQLVPQPPKLEPTTAKDLVQPDIPMKWGLSHRDFELPRCKEVLRRVFCTVLPVDRFDEVWERAQQQLKTPDQLISVNQLRAVMNATAT